MVRQYVCHSSDFQLQWELDFRMNGLNSEKLVDLVRLALGKHDTPLRKAIPPLRNDKILDKIYKNYPCFFFSFAIPCKCFYFYVNIENMHTKIIPLNISFSIVTNM